MAMRNAEITTIIENLTDDFRKMLMSLKSQNGQFLDPNAIVGQLLYVPVPGQTLSLQQLNQNYQTITDTRKNLIEPLHNADDSALVANAAKIHLEAIANGFNAYCQKQEQKTAQAQHRTYAGRAAQQANRPQHVHVHYHPGYYRDPFYDFYRDMMIYQLLFDRDRCHHHGPYNPSTGRTNGNDDDGVSLVGGLLALALIGGAAVTIGYTTMQTYYRIDEMLHGEELLGNAFKLTATGLAAWQGYMLGLLIGATYFANPILGGVCTAIICSGVGMKLGKWGSELATSAFNSETAHDTDPRFCLSNSQATNLTKKGFDPEVIQEALREIATMMKKETANGLKFWHDPHCHLITLMRELKSGYKYDNLVLNDKTFCLKAPFVELPPAYDDDKIPFARQADTAVTGEEFPVQGYPVKRTAPNLYPEIPVAEPVYRAGEKYWTADTVPPSFVVQPTAPVLPQYS